MIILFPFPLPKSLNSFLVHLGKSPKPWTGPAQSSCMLWLLGLSKVASRTPLRLLGPHLQGPSMGPRACQDPACPRASALNCFVSLESGSLLNSVVNRNPISRSQLKSDFLTGAFAKAEALLDSLTWYTPHVTFIVPLFSYDLGQLERLSTCSLLQT